MDNAGSPRRLGWLPVAGAPLDAVKVAAAALMLGDHFNNVILLEGEPILWRLGRIAFPLFSYVTAVHLLRGADPGRYFAMLLLFAVPTQPIYAFAFGVEHASILFTLAAGTALALALTRMAAWVAHATFALSIAITYAAPFPAYTGVDFGLPGMLLPTAMLLCLRYGTWYLAWLLILLFVLNANVERPPDELWWSAGLTDAAFAGLGTALVLGACMMFHGGPRFLPRFALYLFYPGHLAALATLRYFL